MRLIKIYTSPQPLSATLSHSPFSSSFSTLSRRYGTTRDFFPFTIPPLNVFISLVRLYERTKLTVTSENPSFTFKKHFDC